MTTTMTTTTTDDDWQQWRKRGLTMKFGVMGRMEAPKLKRKKSFSRYDVIPVDCVILYSRVWCIGLLQSIRFYLRPLKNRFCHLFFVSCSGRRKRRKGGKEISLAILSRASYEMRIPARGCVRRSFRPSVVPSVGRCLGRSVGLSVCPPVRPPVHPSFRHTRVTCLRNKISGLNKNKIASGTWNYSIRKTIQRWVLEQIARTHLMSELCRTCFFFSLLCILLIFIFFFFVFFIFFFWQGFWKRFSS